MFIFLSKEYRFGAKNTKDGLKYYFKFEESKEKIPGFFVYDFIGEELMLESLKAARDRDFRAVVQTGEYGDHYKTILHDVNSVLGNKRIEPNAKFSGVTFKLEKDGETIELYPEDLSHGELKRLSIYLWLKYRNIEDAIVLMDEIEIAFHPDWQYQIISDLKEWGATNQYILATHSYELCQALTPAHVKEIEPKLIKPEAQN
jgi:predicted ATPase